MLIQNYSKLVLDSKTKHALSILENGLDAALPSNFMKKFVKKGKIHIGKKTIKTSQYNNLYLVCFGKAAYSMAKTTSSILNFKKGLLIMPKDSVPKIKEKKFEFFYSSHPIPSTKSVKAAKKVLKFLNGLQKNDFIIFLVSGGSSALLALPDGVSLADKIKVNKLLLKSGAPIAEINCVRKHFSKIKGGQLIKDLQCDGISLVMSDVQGDDLSSIASGLTYFDKTTFKDALAIIKKYDLDKKISRRALHRLSMGVKGKLPDTPKKPKISNKIVANNQQCIDAMVQRAKELGYSTKTCNTFGDVNDVAKKFVELLPIKKKSCIIFGGEPTVKVKGKGKGGRNQELVLQIANRITTSNTDLVIASLGTDGIDGNTKYAGALVNSSNLYRKQKSFYLANNNSSEFFKKYGGLLKTGKTKTNLMDIGVILN